MGPRFTYSTAHSRPRTPEASLVKHARNEARHTRESAPESAPTAFVRLPYEVTDTNNSETESPRMTEMAADGAFSLEEVGTGSRATLTPSDRAFLESPPAYEEEDESIVPEAPSQRELPTPSARRRVSSLLLFVVITGGATLVLALAGLRLVARALLP